MQLNLEAATPFNTDIITDAIIGWLLTQQSRCVDTCRRMDIIGRRKLSRLTAKPDQLAKSIGGKLP
jgi:hypothetical protein